MLLKIVIFNYWFYYFNLKCLVFFILVIRINSGYDSFFFKLFFWGGMYVIYLFIRDNYKRFIFFILFEWNLFLSF